MRSDKVVGVANKIQKNRLPVLSYRGSALRISIISVASGTQNTGYT